MKLIERLKSFIRPPALPKRSSEERDFVRQVGGSATRIRYCGRSDLVGLKIIGTHRGIRIEQSPRGRYVRIIKMIKGREVITAEALPLRVDRNKNVYVASLRELVG